MYVLCNTVIVPYTIQIVNKINKKWIKMIVVGSAPILVYVVGSCLSDLNCLLQPSGSPISVCSGVLHTLPIYGVVILHRMIRNGIGVHLQSLHGTWYTTPEFSCSVCLSLGCTSILLNVMWGFINVHTHGRSKPSWPWKI